MTPFALLLHAEGFAWTEWTLYPSFLIGWLLLGGAYLLAAGPLRRHFPGSRPVPPLRLLSFATGMLVMLLALQGPLHELSDYFLFSAHMVQHLLLILIMPPFLLYATPDWMLRPLLRLPGVFPVAKLLTYPLVAFALNNVIFLAWHFPGPYDLMMRNHDVHIAMHLLIMAAGTLMWWPVMSPLPELPRIAPPLQMVYLFVLGIPMMFASALITFAADPLYDWYVEAPRISSLNPLDDQRLGGVMMWVPGALALWTAITVVYFRWTHREMREDEQGSTAKPLPTPAGMVTFAPPAYPQRR